MEIWKDIKGYEGSYKVSNLGRVKSLKRVIRYKKGFNKTINEKILKQNTRKDNYITVMLSTVDKGRKTYSVHRLVCISFLKKIPNKNWVNHKDGNPKNNQLLNLEWCTPSENEIHKIHILNNYTLKNVTNLKNVERSVNPIKINGKNCYGEKMQKLYIDLKNGKKISSRSNEYGAIRYLIHNLCRRFNVKIKRDKKNRYVEYSI